MKRRPEILAAGSVPDVYKTYSFANADAAWRFMRACGAARLRCGFPTPDNTCEVNLTTHPDVALYDRLAGEKA